MSKPSFLFLMLSTSMVVCRDQGHDMEGGGHSETTVMPDCLEDGISYKGNNIVDGEDNVQDTIHDCQQSCSKHPKCVQWTWGKLEGRFAGWCYLKSSKTGEILKLPDVVTGTKDCPTDSYIDENSEPLPTVVMPDCLEDGKNYIGNNIVEGEDNLQDTMHDCQQSCAKHPKCEQWTWGKLEGRYAGWCYHKSSKAGDIETLPDVVTGTKNCPTDSYIDGNSEPLPRVVMANCLEDGISYQGNNIVEGEDNVQDTMHDCQQSCAKHPKCEQWTWGKLSYMSLPGRFPGWCYLKSSKTGEIFKIPDVVTGSKDCPTDSYIDSNREPSPKVDCGFLLISGDFNENGLYYFKTGSNEEMVEVTTDTRVYADLRENMHLYHRRYVGWVIGAESSMYSADDSMISVISGVTDTDIIFGGRWDNGAVTTCLDDGKCQSYGDNLDVEPNLRSHYPFTDRLQSMDGTFCSRVQYGEHVFQYTNRTDPFGFPIYASGEMILTKTPGRHFPHEISQENYSKKHYVITNERYHNNPSIKFDAKSAQCTRSSKVAVPATAIHAWYGLPYGSLSQATEWELGVTVNVLQSHVSTYFMTVGWGPGGYSGIQETTDHGMAPSGKLALFSFWNHGGDSVSPTFINTEAGVRYDEFSGEGTGIHTWVDYPWQIQQITGLRIRGSRSDQWSSHWDVDSYLRDLNNPDQWIHMATLSRTSNEHPLEYGGFYVFIEDWDGSECAQGFRYKREAEFLNPYALVDGKQVDLEKPGFTHTTSYAIPLIIQENIGDFDVRMSTGGLRIPLN